MELDASGSTVAEALAALWQAYPGLRDRILTEQGEVRQHVNIFVGEENIRYCGGFAAAVRNGSSITVIPAVSGGTDETRHSLDDLFRIHQHSGVSLKRYSVRHSVQRHKKTRPLQENLPSIEDLEAELSETANPEKHDE